MRKFVLAALCVAAIASSGCSREQGDWEKARAANNTDSYELFIKKYPAGEFTAQAQARVKELYEERDWQKARDGDTLEAYQGFLKQHPDGKWTEEARIRVENFSLPETPNGAAGGPAAGGPAGAAAPASAAAAPAGTVPGAAAAPPAAPPKAGAVAPVAPNPTARKPAAAAAGPAAPTVASAAEKKPGSPAAGRYAVQLGAFKSGAAAANRRWASLEKRYPSILAGLKHHVAAGGAGKGKLYRLQVRGLSAAKARSICNSLKAKAQACVLVPPRH
jgi:cell division protein FtsN